MAKVINFKNKKVINFYCLFLCARCCLSALQAFFELTLTAAP